VQTLVQAAKTGIAQAVLVEGGNIGWRVDRVSFEDYTGYGVDALLLL